MVIIPYILYMKKNLTIHRLSTTSLVLIAQFTAEKRHTLLLLSSFGHPVGSTTRPPLIYLNFFLFTFEASQEVQFYVKSGYK